MAKIIHITHVVAETDEDLETALNAIDGDIIQCVNTMPGSKGNRKFQVMYEANT